MEWYRSCNFVLKIKPGKTIWYMVLIELMRIVHQTTCQDLEEDYERQGNGNRISNSYFCRKSL